MFVTDHDHVEPMPGVMSASEQIFTIISMDQQLYCQVAFLGGQVHVF